MLLLLLRKEKLLRKASNFPMFSADFVKFSQCIRIFLSEQLVEKISCYRREFDYCNVTFFDEVSLHSTTYFFL